MPANVQAFYVDPVPGSDAVRVWAWSDVPFGTNAFVRAWVGEHELTGVTIDQYGATFRGFLAAMPTDNDTLRVSVNGEEPVDTGLTAEKSPSA